MQETSRQTERYYRWPRNGRVHTPPGELTTLGDRLTPAKGWQFRAPAFGEELTLTMDGKVNVATDDFRNIYNMAAKAREPGKSRR
jgi:hypothetical protein